MRNPRLALPRSTSPPRGSTVLAASGHFRNVRKWRELGLTDEPPHVVFRHDGPTAGAECCRRPSRSASTLVARGTESNRVENLDRHLSCHKGYLETLVVDGSARNIGFAILSWLGASRLTHSSRTTSRRRRRPPTALVVVVDA
jgi:hypothetical protein